MHDSDMDLNSLYEHNLLALPQQEQALAWLIENGPLVDEPPLPMTVLRNLVKRQRLVRLRRGLYLAPTPAAQLPSFPRTINLVDPDGYISGHGALSLHDLTDQDVVRWYSVSTRRQADITYGPFSAHFVLSAVRRRAASTSEVTVRGDRIVVATPARAIVDEVELMPLGLDYAETARILRYAVDTRAATEDILVAEMECTPSIAGARRLGFLLDLATGHRNARLLEIAQSSPGMTRTSRDRVAEYLWRLYLPERRATILGASR
jgi:predicted transcriptional regulator of viral defense system